MMSHPHLSCRKDISSNHLTDLNGLDNLTALTHLNVSMNSLTTVDGIDVLLQLEVLTLEDNKLTTLEGCNKLKLVTDMDASQNQIAELPRLGGILESMAKLSVLTLRGNPVCDAKSYEAVCTRNVSLTMLDGLPVSPGLQEAIAARKGECAIEDATDKLRDEHVVRMQHERELVETRIRELHEKEIELLNHYNEFETKQTDTLEHQLAYMLGEVPEYISSEPLPTIEMPDKDAVAKKKAAAAAEAAAARAAIKVKAEAEAAARAKAAAEAKAAQERMELKRDLSFAQKDAAAANEAETKGAGTNGLSDRDKGVAAKKKAAAEAEAKRRGSDDGDVDSLLSTGTASTLSATSDHPDDAVEAVGRLCREKFSIKKVVQKKVKAETSGEIFKLLLSHTMRVIEQACGHKMDQKRPAKWVSMEYRAKFLARKKERGTKKEASEVADQTLAEQHHKFVASENRLLGTLEEVPEGGTGSVRAGTADITQYAAL